MWRTIKNVFFWIGRRVKEGWVGIRPFIIIIIRSQEDELADFIDRMKDQISSKELAKEIIEKIVNKIKSL